MNIRIHKLMIGALAKAVGVSTPTIRYYEEIELLPPAERTQSGQRIYYPSDITRITFIKRCRDFGFSIDQVRLLVGLSISQDKDCTEARDIADKHLKEVRKRLKELQALESSLNNFVETCETVCVGGASVDCTIFKDLSNLEPKCR